MWKRRKKRREGRNADLLEMSSFVPKINPRQIISMVFLRIWRGCIYSNAMREDALAGSSAAAAAARAGTE